jgi:8-oxo-dGTP pyrophosphatase MutT (NUDIX family)
MTLYDNAVATLRGWAAPDEAGEHARARTLAFLADAPDGMWREHAGGHVTASALVVDAAAERVLLCLHAKFGLWVQMGGHCEPGDPDLAAAALREATEESGIPGLRISPTPIGVDIHRVGCGGGALHYDVRYAAVAPPGAVEAVSPESLALRWYSPGALPTPLADAVECLVAPALGWAATIRCADRGPADAARPRPA